MAAWRVVPDGERLLCLRGPSATVAVGRRRENCILPFVFLLSCIVALGGSGWAVRRRPPSPTAVASKWSGQAGGAAFPTRPHPPPSSSTPHPPSTPRCNTLCRHPRRGRGAHHASARGCGGALDAGTARAAALASPLHAGQAPLAAPPLPVVVPAPSVDPVPIAAAWRTAVSRPSRLSPPPPPHRRHARVSVFAFFFCILSSSKAAVVSATDSGRSEVVTRLFIRPEQILPILHFRAGRLARERWRRPSAAAGQVWRGQRPEDTCPRLQ